MKPLEISVSQDFAYQIDIHPVPPTGGHHLKISSQWKGAKDPNERRRQFSMTVPVADAEALHAWLGEYLSEIRNS